MMLLQYVGIFFLGSRPARPHLLVLNSPLPDLIVCCRPQIVHVAGTKGKGSTATLISSILRAAGLSVGTYTRCDRQTHSVPALFRSAAAFFFFLRKMFDEDEVFLECSDLGKWWHSINCLEPWAARMFPRFGRG